MLYDLEMREIVVSRVIFFQSNIGVDLRPQNVCGMQCSGSYARDFIKTILSVWFTCFFVVSIVKKTGKVAALSEEIQGS